MVRSGFLRQAWTWFTVQLAKTQWILQKKYRLTLMATALNATILGLALKREARL